MPIRKAKLFSALTEELLAVLGLEPKDGELIRFWKPPFLLHRSDVDFELEAKELQAVLAREFISSLVDFVPDLGDDGYTVRSTRVSLSDQYEFILKGATYHSTMAAPESEEKFFALTKSRAVDKWDLHEATGIPNGILDNVLFRPTATSPSEWWNSTDPSLWRRVKVDVKDIVPPVELSDASKLVALGKRLQQESDEFQMLIAAVVGGISVHAHGHVPKVLLGHHAKPALGMLAQPTTANVGAHNLGGSQNIALPAHNFGGVNLGQGLVGQKAQALPTTHGFGDLLQNVDNDLLVTSTDIGLVKHGGIKIVDLGIGKKPSLLVEGVMVKNGKELEDLVCGTSIRSPKTRQSLSVAVDAHRSYAPLTVSRAVISFEVCVIRLIRRWWDDQFVGSKAWCIAGLKKGHIKDLIGVNLSHYCAAAFVIRDLKIELIGDIDDPDELKGSTQFGPFVVEMDEKNDRSLEYAGMQLVAWSLIPLPSIPPVDS